MCTTCDENDRRENLEAELTEAKAEIELYKDGANQSICTYCGHKGPKNLHAMAEHMAVCKKHPVPVLLKENAALREKLLTLSGETNCCMTCEGYAKKLERAVEALTKIKDEGTHMFWESRGMDQMQHCENCPPCLAEKALQPTPLRDGGEANKRRVDSGGEDNICGACGDLDPYGEHSHG